jgi:hypothetical protein
MPATVRLRWSQTRLQTVTVQLLRSVSDEALKQDRETHQPCPSLLEMGMQTGQDDGRLSSAHLNTTRHRPDSRTRAQRFIASSKLQFRFTHRVAPSIRLKHTACLTFSRLDQRRLRFSGFSWLGHPPRLS